MEDIIGSPLLGVLVGAGLTYLLARRGQRREAIDSMFDSAIAKVAILQASRLHPTQIHGETFGAEDRQALETELKQQGYRHFVSRAAECREALAALHPYCSALRPYWEKFEVEPQEIDEVIRLLQDCRPKTRLRLSRA